METIMQHIVTRTPAFTPIAAARPARPALLAPSMRRRRARLTETLFQCAAAALLLSSGAAAIGRLLWMGQ